MKTTVSNTIKKFVVLILIGVMGMLIANKAIFLHAHKLSNGVVIEHAHPFDKSNDSGPYKSHHHSNAEFSLLSNLEILFLVLFLTFAFGLFIKKEQSLFKTKVRYNLIGISLKKGRAPPYQNINITAFFF